MKLAALQHQHTVGALDRLFPMSEDYPSYAELANGVIHLPLSLSIEMGSTLVKHENLGPAIQGAG